MILDRFRLDDRAAVVTGAGRGIGRATAVRFAEEGASVVVNDVDPDPAEETAAAIKEAGGQVLVSIDNTVELDQARQMMNKAAEAFGGVDILVNNAGITRDNLLMRMDADEWDAVIDTNLGGPFWMTRAISRPMMKARAGRIINMSSAAGRMGNAGQANYAAAKAGVVGMTRSLARELGSRNITVNCVAPGFIDTDMTRALSDEQKKALLEAIPLGRLGTPQDVAAAVAYLASPGGGYVTGAVLHVNGGMYMA